MATDRARSLRILSLDGGGMKGYTSLLILQRIFRTLQDAAQLEAPPKPCDVFDLIVGTSTGGLIAIMLGRVGMTIEEAINQYEVVGHKVFGKKPHFGRFGKLVRGLSGKAFYDIEILQECVKDALESRRIDPDEAFIKNESTSCKVMVCVTSKFTTNVDALRSYASYHPTTHNYDCTIWEAASATAAAPVFFNRVKFRTGDEFVDGGLRRNNPVEEALNEARKENLMVDREIGCLVSIGTGLHGINEIPPDVTRVLKQAIKMMTDSQDTADRFSQSREGRQLTSSGRYFRFNVPQGMEHLKMDEYESKDKMKALALNYLHKEDVGAAIASCAKALANPDVGYEKFIRRRNVSFPGSTNVDDIESKCLMSLRFRGIDKWRASIKPPIKRTCDWLLRHETFTTWLEHRDAKMQNGLLWIKGRPGSGKSTVMWESYRRLPQLLGEEASHYAAFFFDSKGDELLHSPEGLYRSLLYQLLLHRRTDLRRVAQAYKGQLDDGTQMGSWDEDELQMQIRTLFEDPASTPRTTIFIDAIDECNNDKLREVAGFFEKLAKSANSAGIKLNICLSSRHFNAVTLRNCPIIIVEQNNNQDILCYLTQHLYCNDTDRKNEQAFGQLTKSVADMSSGIFLWVVLVTELLSKDQDEGRSMKDLKGRLSNVPVAFENLFKDLLNQVKEEDRDMTLHLFQWVILGGELCLQEWRYILLFLEHWMPSRPRRAKGSLDGLKSDMEVEKRIRHISRGLVEVTIPATPHSWAETRSENNSVNVGVGSLDLETGDSRLVKVIHPSVKDFFLHQNGFLTLSPELGSCAIGKGHIAIMNTCLDYIALPGLDELASARQEVQSTSGRDDASSVKSRWKFKSGSSVTSFSSARSVRATRALRIPSSGGGASSSGREDLVPQALPETGFKENIFSDWIASASAQPMAEEMQQYRLSLLDLAVNAEWQSSPPTGSDLSSILAEGNDRLLSADPSFLQYVLSSFSHHARLAEKEGADATKIVFRLCEEGLWKRWICLDEEIPTDLRLIDWAEAARLTSWVILISRSWVDPAMAVTEKEFLAAASRLAHESPILDYCFDRGYSFLEEINHDSICQIPSNFSLKWLQKRLELAFRKSFMPSCSSVPRQWLFEQMPLPIIEKLLQEIGLPLDMAPTIFASFRVILAILLVLDKSEFIVDFVRQGVFDSCLPLKFDERGGVHFLNHPLDVGNGNDCYLTGWSDFIAEVFEYQQMRFLRPYLARPGSRILHYKLLNLGDGLPITNEHHISRHISKIQLHPAFCKAGDFPLNNEDNWYVRDMHSSWRRFLFAVYAWKYINSHGKDGRKFLPLLFTIETQSAKESLQYSLVFPWPAGDLNQFWKTYPDGGNTHTHTPEWLAFQCCGISHCLAAFHRAEITNQAPSQRRRFNLGGDMTADNVLWYYNSPRQRDGSLLVFSNFSIREEPYASTVYVAPELRPFNTLEDHGRLKAGRRADIWGLACICIELVTWHLKGLEGLSNLHGSAEPFFWEFSGNDAEGLAVVRGSVKDWVQSLRQHQNCNAYFHEFLSYIDERMLVVDPKKRATAAEVSERMEKLLSAQTLGQ